MQQLMCWRKVSRRRFTLPIIVHASFRLQPGSLATTLVGDVDLVVLRLDGYSAAVWARISGVASTYRSSHLWRGPKLCGFGENQWICEDISLGDAPPRL